MKQFFKKESSSYTDSTLPFVLNKTKIENKINDKPKTKAIKLGIFSKFKFGGTTVKANNKLYNINTKQLTTDIAKSILKQGTVKGKPLSKRQKALFKAIAKLENKNPEVLKQYSTKTKKFQTGGTLSKTGRINFMENFGGGKAGFSKLITPDQARQIRLQVDAATHLSEINKKKLFMQLVDAQAHKNALDNPTKFYSDPNSNTNFHKENYESAKFNVAELLKPESKSDDYFMSPEIIKERESYYPPYNPITEQEKKKYKLKPIEKKSISETVLSKHKSGGKNWIQGAVKKPGSFTAYCKSKGYDGVTNSCISEGKNSSNPLTRKRATLAQTFRKMK